MLKDFYIGDSNEYITVEYAKSGRAACKKCKDKIGMEELRVGILVDDDHFSTGQGTQWFHQACFHFKPRHKVLELQSLKKKIHNVETLNKKDQKNILSYLKAQLESVKSGKSKKKAQAKPKNQSKKQSERSVSQPQEKPESKSKGQRGRPKNIDLAESKSKNNAVSKSKKMAVSKSKSKAEESKPKSKGKIQAKKERPKIQPTRKGLRSQSVVTENADKATEAQEKPKRVIKNIKKQKKEAPKKFISESQNKHYKELVQEFEEMTMPELKEILGKNNQPKTGAKPELIARCADGKQFGRIPNCSKCGGGKLRFNRLTGKYNCPGYMEDTDFVNCSVKFDFEEVKRLEWNN